jgi:radical SAM-linked protein
MGLHRFLSHKSRTRLIKLALKRAQIPVKYREGFHPYISIIYCPPAPVGVSAGDDFFIVQCRASLGENIPIDKMNRSLPCGMRVSRAEPVSDGKARAALKGLMAVYRFSFKPGSINAKERAEKIMEQKELVLKRDGKKDKDVRPCIARLITEEADSIEAHLSAEQDRYLSPVDFAKILLGRSDEEFWRFLDIERKGFYTEKGI